MDQTFYRMFAVRYGRLERRSPQNFIGGDDHDVPMPLDYFVWVIQGEQASYVVDTGYGEETGRRRGRSITRSVAEGLGALGIDPAAVRDVILTHLHYDHAGNHDLFPNAKYHLQDSEMAYCTGRQMCHGFLAHHYECEDVTAMVRNVFDGRVRFHDGAADFAPGISLHRVGGHTGGQQVVRVSTRRGWVVLASDAAHFYANLARGTPFPAIYHAGEMLEGFRTLRALADSDDHIIPGHDPEVIRRYPAFSPATEGWIVRLDQPPRRP
ncbi:MAG: N-acyl homoserine lactonase family protein [Rhizobiaceae bacterium]